MKKSVIYALDFDGVICDSAIETGVSAWKAGATIWDDYLTPLPSTELLEQFRQVRPVLATGYESILIVRMLMNGETTGEIMKDYANSIQRIQRLSNLNIDSLKVLFGKTRDNWINENLDEWLNMNPLFPGVKEKLNNLSEQAMWYIVTTKQERFVKQIFAANQVNISDDRIYGLDREMSKEEVLIGLLKKHPENTFYYIEDLLSMLLKVKNNNKLGTVQLFLALWGYNTAEDKVKAEKQAIQLIDLDEFLV